MKFSHLLICVLAVNGGVDAARLRGLQSQDSTTSTDPLQGDAAANDATASTFTTPDAIAVVNVNYLSVNTPNLAAAMAADTAAGDVVQILTPAADATGCTDSTGCT